MKTAIVVAMALVGVSSIPFHAQQASGKAQQSVQRAVSASSTPDAAQHKRHLDSGMQVRPGISSAVNR